VHQDKTKIVKLELIVLYLNEAMLIVKWVVVIVKFYQKIHLQVCKKYNSILNFLKTIYYWTNTEHIIQLSKAYNYPVFMSLSG